MTPEAATLSDAAAAPATGEPSRNLVRMLEARSVALVGASRTPNGFGDRALTELERSPGAPAIHLVNPRYAGDEIRGHPVVASLDDLPEPVDLVLLAVGDEHVEAELARAARRGDGSAVVYGSAVGDGLRDRLAAIAGEAGMSLCGGGCMGFVSRQVRAIGYLEHAPLPAGPIALVTHSGSAFSALLRTDRMLGWSLAVSSGQELVTTTAEYLEYALALPETQIVALLLETLRDPDRLRGVLQRAADTNVPVVAVTVGTSAPGRAMVAAHSGALAGSDGAWEALFDACGVVRVDDLHELCDTLELLVAGRRAPSRRGRTGTAHDGAAATEGSTPYDGAPATDGAAESHPRPGGIAAVLDSGAERALLVDVAAACGVSFAPLSPATEARLAALLDPGLEVANPLDVWGRGRSTEDLFTETLVALAEEPSVDAVALAVDLVTELDCDESYRTAVTTAWQRSDVPLCVLTHVPSALDRTAAVALRGRGVPVLEGTRSGLLALRHLQELRDFADRPAIRPIPPDPDRAGRWARRLADGSLGPVESFELLADYGLAAPATRSVASREDALSAAEAIGYPVVLKTAAAAHLHKSDVGGVVLGLEDAGSLTAAYDSVSSRLGPEALVAAGAPPGVELALGIVRDPLLGPLVVVGAGGTLVELLSDRAVALPPLDRGAARRLLDRLGVRRLLDGYRGGAAANVDAAADALAAVASIAAELGHVIAALDINPLRCGAGGALALDVLIESTRPAAP